MFKDTATENSMNQFQKIMMNTCQNLNDNSSPKHIIVEFPQYIGPPCMKEHSNWFPIPAISLYCQTCCQVK